MARPKKIAAPEDIIDVLPADNDHLSKIQQEGVDRMAVIIRDFGDGLPFDEARYEHVIRGHLTRSAEEMLAAGRALIVAKEYLGHGDWMSFTDRLGLQPRLTQRMMQAALKFSNASTSTHLIEAAGSKSKLFELMVLDDDDIKELSDGGTVAGLELDDITRMPVSELRAKLREERDESKARDQVLAARNARIDKVEAELQATKRRINALPPDEEVENLRKEFQAQTLDAEQLIRQALREGVEALRELGERIGQDSEAVIAGGIAQIQGALDTLRIEYGINPVGQAAPVWAEE